MQPAWFSDPGHDEQGCECGCDDNVTDDGERMTDFCEACLRAGCSYSGGCRRPVVMTVDHGDEETLDATSFEAARSEARARVLARWGWYSNDGEESAVQVALTDGRMTVFFQVQP